MKVVEEETVDEEPKWVNSDAFVELFCLLNGSQGTQLGDHIL